MPLRTINAHDGKGWSVWAMHGGLATTGERAGSRNSEASVVGDIRFSLMIQSVRALLSAAHQWLN
jgi:hypothetical protein